MVVSALADITTGTQRPPAGTREHVGEFRRVKWPRPDAPEWSGDFAIIELADGTSVKGPFSPESFAESVLYRFLGRWEPGRNGYGPTFAADTFTTAKPAGKAGAVAFLMEFADNVGRGTAEKLWGRYGALCIQTLRLTPERVAADGVMTPDAAREASNALQLHVGTEQTRVDLYELFKGRGFPGALYKAVLGKWGARVGEVVRRNPYALLVNKLPGCGFKRCDKLWIDLGKPPAALKRQMIAAWNWLRNDTNGHTWFLASEVVDTIEREISGSSKESRVKAIKLGIRARWIAKHRTPDGKLFLADFRRAAAEHRIADAIADLNRSPLLWPTELPISERPDDGLPTQHQHDTALSALRTPVAILAGTPGTGKSHVLAFILRQAIARFGVESVAVCAPTGKAAVRSTQAIKRLGIDVRATTIHRLLKIGRNGHDGDGWGFQHGRGNPLPFRVVVVDETSMVPTDLMASLLDACQPPSICPATEEIKVNVGGSVPPRCLRCNRPLTNPESWKIGHGPECARRVSPSDYQAVTPTTADDEIVFPAMPALSLPGTHVLLIGDPYQLPPVGHGAPFRDLIDSGTVGYGELSEVHRNAGMIVQACRDIKDGNDFQTADRIDLDAKPPINLRMVEARSESLAVASLDKLLTAMAASRRFDPVWQTQVITPRNKQSKVSRTELNSRLQQLLNPVGVQAKGNPFRVGDKIICLKNGWNQVVHPNRWKVESSGDATPTDAKAYEPVKIPRDGDEDGPPDDRWELASGIQGEPGEPAELYVANGEIGRVVAVSDSLTIARFGDEGWTIKIPMGKQRRGKGDDGEGDGGDSDGGEKGKGSNYDLAYAISIHKSQGSESPVIIMMIDEGAGLIASRELIYTGLSRASKLCVLIGRKDILERQAKKPALTRRRTFLTELLKGAVK